MNISYKIDKPTSFTLSEKLVFLELLREQNQVKNPSIKKLNLCHYLCFAYADDNVIGIGALKDIYKTPFDYAMIKKDIKDIFNYELGYIYVKDNEKFRGHGIGKYISKFLTEKVKANIFATTENHKLNPMLHILKSLEFKQFGKSYIGKKSKKNIILLLKFKH
jgi:hypothetical protein